MMPKRTVNKSAAKWAHKHAGALIDGVSKTTRREIRDLVTDAFKSGKSVRTLIKDIAATLGDDERAATIARTETMYAANHGKLLEAQDAVDAGDLSEDAVKEWITTPDDLLCPICEPMDGVQVPLDEDFDVDGDSIDGPPAHPNCRCTVVVTAR